MKRNYDGYDDYRSPPKSDWVGLVQIFILGIVLAVFIGMVAGIGSALI